MDKSSKMKLSDKTRSVQMVNFLLVVMAFVVIGVTFGCAIWWAGQRDKMFNYFRSSCLPGMLLESQNSPRVASEIFASSNSFMLLCTDGDRKWIKHVEYK